MDLLKLMLEKDPEKRISSFNALSHPAFHVVLSKSPLLKREAFDSKAFIDQLDLVHKFIN